MIKLLAMIAAIAPTSVEFHIHHVVHAFQTKVVNMVKKIKCNLFSILSATNNNGIHAIKIKNVKGETGHDVYNKIPERIARPISCNFFNQQNFIEQYREKFEKH